MNAVGHSNQWLLCCLSAQQPVAGLLSAYKRNCRRLHDVWHLTSTPAVAVAVAVPVLHEQHGKQHGIS